MPLDNKCRIGPLAGAPPDVCGGHSLRPGFITEDDTSSLSHPARGRQKFDTAYDVSVVSEGRRLLSVSRLLMAGTGCLEGGKRR
ncbi:hypothetical protein TNCV_2142271 [Trichonephila clavipes]|uniref:Uncharacterized protein n=1 Tax=Trichonephila clavipes TaxID=2585209 RepID=A0A8X6RXX4_TRICX|nr:hypothetical protein TNCV_2142271 [Trichonephila clavipes]